MYTWWYVQFLNNIIDNIFSIKYFYYYSGLLLIVQKCPLYTDILRFLTVYKMLKKSFIFSCSLAGGGLLRLLHHSLLPEPEAGAQGGRLAIQQVSQPQSTKEGALTSLDLVCQSKIARN
jgi:hypothetical protein